MKRANASMSNLIMNKEFTIAEKEGRKGLEVDNTYLQIKVNIAHALLFQNKDKEA